MPSHDLGMATAANATAALGPPTANTTSGLAVGVVFGQSNGRLSTAQSAANHTAGSAATRAGLSPIRNGSRSRSSSNSHDRNFLPPQPGSNRDRSPIRPREGNFGLQQSFFATTTNTNNATALTPNHTASTFFFSSPSKADAKVAAEPPSPTIISGSGPSTFAAASLPRKSSLLPPPLITKGAFRNPAALAPPTPTSSRYQNHRRPSTASPARGPSIDASAVTPPEIVVGGDNYHRSQHIQDSDGARPVRRPSGSHRRSSSLGRLSAGFRNLHRWSASTASSQGVDFGAPKSPAFSNFILHSGGTQPGAAPDRRKSIDATSPEQIQSNRSPGTRQSPKRIVIGPRPSTSGGPGARSSPLPISRFQNQTSFGVARSPGRPSVPPISTLPPIVTLPPFEQSVGADAWGLSRDPIHEAQQAEDRAFWDLYHTAQATIASQTRDRSNNASPARGSPARGQLRRMPQPEVNGSGGGGDIPRPRGHSRNRSQSAAKGSADTTSSTRSRADSRSGPPKPASQKAMLSKALQKANIAVKLDNAHNYEAARVSYLEACELLQQVLVRTVGSEDREKLEAIVRLIPSPTCDVI